MFQALWQDYKNPKTENGKDESFTTKGKFNYVPISFYKDKTVKDVCYFLVGEKLIPISAYNLWGLLDKMEKGEASGVTSFKKVIEPIQEISKEEEDIDWQYCDDCDADTKCPECYSCVKNGEESHSHDCTYA